MVVLVWLVGVVSCVGIGRIGGVNIVGEGVGAGVVSGVGGVSIVWCR